MNKLKSNMLLMASIAMGGGMPSIKVPESNTRMNDLPEGFKEWWFNRDTGELITDEDAGKKIEIFRVTSRTEENARKEFKRLIK